MVSGQGKKPRFRCKLTISGLGGTLKPRFDGDIQGAWVQPRNYLRRVFLPEPPNDAANRARRFQRASPERAPLASQLDRDRRVHEQVAVPLGPRTVDRQQPQRVICRDEPDRQCNGPPCTAADYAYGNLPAVLQQTINPIPGSHSAKPREDQSSSPERWPAACGLPV